MSEDKCPVCGEQYQYAQPAGCGAAGNLVCTHTELKCLRRQLAAVTAQRDRAWEACSAVTGVRYTNPQAYAMCEAVVAEADKAQAEGRGQ